VLQNDFENAVYGFLAHLHDSILGPQIGAKAVSHVVTAWPHTHPQELPWEGIIKSRKSIN
jgi:hypothetical protein